VSDVTQPPDRPSGLPRVQRVAAYAVIVRDEHLLLSRLAGRISATELWTLPGGGLDHGEHPRDAVVREVWEETGLRVVVESTARIYSGHQPGVWRDGRRVDAHAVRIVYAGWVPPNSPEPRVVEVDGSTIDAAWVRIADVVSGTIPVVPMVKEALAEIYPARYQRTAAYALIRREDRVLLTRLSSIAPDAGSWTLPGGGVDHGETPSETVRREVAEECGVACDVGALLGVHDTHFTGSGPDGHTEDYHGIHLVYSATIDQDAEPVLAETEGTVDAVAWVSYADIDSGVVSVVDLVSFALAAVVPWRGTARGSTPIGP
jgi:8-oxo-dGTP diphosphatase